MVHRQNPTRVELLWRTLMSRCRVSFNHLADWSDGNLPTGTGLLLPQLMRLHLFLHLNRSSRQVDNDVSASYNSTSHVPNEIRTAYSQRLESSLASIIAQEPESIDFLPKPGECDSFFVNFSRDIESSVLLMIQAGEEHQRSWRQKADSLSLYLPDSFTKLPQIQLGYNPPSEVPGQAESWYIGLLNGLESLFDAIIFRTETHLFGMTMCSMQRNDEIWILDGAFAPVCLRPLAGGKYEFLGEVYTYGLMNGEAVQFCKDPISITIE